MKRIIICCDGTWNFPDKTEENIPCATNVVKLALAVKNVSGDRIEQLTYYHPGVGTSGWIIQRWFDGATGSGISSNILNAYTYIIKNYILGDELFLFGFSRGAFTARSLAGLIRNSGILTRNDPDLIERAYKLYKSRSPSTHPREKEATLFRKSYAVADKVPIKFIGVWDTVGSLGNPLFINNVFSKFSLSVMSNRFHDTDLSSTVNYAYQAIAVDEKRRNFKPTLWRQQETSDKQILEQVWFIGVHSNVGGGYTQTGLSDIAMDWLVSRARDCGLDIGIILSAENPSEVPSESWKGFYKLLPPYCRRIGEKENGNESIHKSVLERYNNDVKYRPKNLKKYLSRLSSTAQSSDS